MNNRGKTHIITAEAQDKGRQSRAEKLTKKQQAFAEMFAKTKNGTQTALSVYDTTSPSVAGSIASENLAKPKIRQEIARLLSENDIELRDVLKIHKRNLMQSKHFPTSQKAVEDFYDLLGLTEKQPPQGVQIAFVIEN